MKPWIAAGKPPTRSFTALLLTLTALTGQADPAGGGCLTEARLGEWLAAYGAAWESRDPDGAARLFTADARYQVTPFEDPHLGPDGVRDYWAGVTAAQRNVEFGYRVLAVSGQTGIAHWSARFDVEPSGDALRLDGIFVLDFDDQCLCRQLREWWHLEATPQREAAGDGR